MGQTIWNNALSATTATSKASLAVATGVAAVPVVVKAGATAATVFTVFRAAAGGPLGLTLLAAPVVVDWLMTKDIRAKKVGEDVQWEKLDKLLCSKEPCQPEDRRLCFRNNTITACGSWTNTEEGRGSSFANAFASAMGGTVRGFDNYGWVDWTDKDGRNQGGPYGSPETRPAVIIPPSASWNPITVDAVRSIMENTPPAAGLPQAILDAGGTIPLSYVPSAYAPGSNFVPVDGPASISAPPVVRVTNDGTDTTTTTTTQKTDLKYDTGPHPETGQPVARVTATTNTTITTTVINNTTNNVVSNKTTNENNPSAPPVVTTPKDAEKTPEDYTATDAALPGQPTLYTPKYPRGIVGVWDDQKAQLNNTPLARLAPSLMPSVPGGGACPAMPINLTFTTWASFGVADVAPPCYVWDWAKAIVILGALLLARALIFGG